MIRAGQHERMSPNSQRNLREAWFGQFSADYLARRHRLNDGRAVRRFWEAERAAGRLPQGARPHFADVTFGNAPTVDASLDAEIDASETVAEASGMRIPDCDPLLEALYAAHDCDPRRAVEAHATEILASMDAGKVFPSPAALVLSARILDGAMRRVLPAKA